MLKLLSFIPLLAVCLSTATFAERIDKPDNSSAMIQPFTAEYSIIRQGDVVGSAVRKLVYLDDNQAEYSYKTNIKWLIFSDNRTEKSIVSLTDNKVVPRHYHYKRKGTGPDKRYEWQYDIEKGKADDIKNKRTITVDFPNNVQDKLSYHFQHRLNIKNNPTQKHFVYPVLSTSGTIKNYVYQYDGEEELMLPYGTLKTIRLKREVVEKNRITYAWFAPELDYLMVKLFQSKKGVEQFQAHLNKLTINSVASVSNQN